jgi:membrane-associated phospholipid phosphatase
METRHIESREMVLLIRGNIKITKGTKNMKRKKNTSILSELHKIVNILLQQVTELGGMAFYAIIMVLFIFIDPTRSLHLLISLVAIMIVSVSIKYLYFTHRPKKQSTSTLVERLDASSFPSIHSMRALALGYWLSHYFNNIFITAYITIVAVLVMVSRILLKKHYLRDVIWGAIFAAIIVCIQAMISGNI